MPAHWLLQQSVFRYKFDTLARVPFALELFANLSSFRLWLPLPVFGVCLPAACFFLNLKLAQ